MTTPLTFGNTPVPYTVLWSDEDPMHIERCPYASREALCNVVAPGGGTPVFGKPHMQRQREVIQRGLCDLCGKSLDRRTKVSLSHAQPRIGAGSQLCVMQVEPLLHKDCAAICLKYCPSLRRDLRQGTLAARLVTRYRVQFAMLTGPATLEFCGVYAPGTVGHAKVELLQWKDKDEKWLI